MTRVVVAAWAGSKNLGDELLLEATIRMLRARGMEPVVISVDPERTAEEFDVEAVHHLSRRALAAAFDGADAMVFGGGGLLQDETSAWNLGYHLSRVRNADRRGLPWVGIGLGAAGITTTRGERTVRRALRHHRMLVVRDALSHDRLHDLGIPNVALGADLAWTLPRPATEPADVCIVTLRLPQTSRWVPGAISQPKGRTPEWEATMAESLDRVHEVTGWTIRFVAFEAGADDVLHDRVAERMASPSESVIPTRTALLSTIGAARAIVSMRYHGIVTASMVGVPGVAVTFSPKLGGVADSLGLPAAPPTIAGIRTIPALALALASVDASEEIARASVNGQALDLLAGT